MKRTGSLALVKRKRKQIIAIAKKHGATNVRVFGSTVRGSEQADSDIDLLVRLSGKPGPWFPAGMSNELTILLGRPVDIVTERALRPELRKYVLKEAVPL